MAITVPIKAWSAICPLNLCRQQLSLWVQFITWNLKKPSSMAGHQEPETIPSTSKMSTHQELENTPVHNRPLEHYPDESGNMEQGKLYTIELFWRDHQPWLEESGFLLRSRYHPDWVASWIKDSNKNPLRCEDAIGNKVRCCTVCRRNSFINYSGSISYGCHSDFRWPIRHAETKTSQQ